MSQIYKIIIRRPHIDNILLSLNALGVEIERKYMSGIVFLKATDSQISQIRLWDEVSIVERVIA